MSNNKVVSHMSADSTDLRHVYTEDGVTLLGVIFKAGRGRYRVLRIDGKERVKGTLKEAFKTIRRSN